MALESTEDARKYLKDIDEQLKELAQLSKRAGLNTHLAMWYGIKAAFLDSAEEIDTLTEVIDIYVENRISRYDREQSTPLFSL